MPAKKEIPRVYRRGRGTRNAPRHCPAPREARGKPEEEGQHYVPRALSWRTKPMARHRWEGSARSAA